MKKISIPIRFRPYGWAVLGALLLMMLPSAKLHAAERASYRLKWIFNASVLGDIYADVNGFFARQGLEVDVKAGGPERDAIMELELGRTEFGVASADQVIRALSKGARLKVIAQIFQVNPLQWMYRPDQMRIETLADLKGRRLGVTFGGNDESILRTLLTKGGLGENDVELFSVRNDFTPFLTKKVNFWPVYRNTQAVFLEAKLKDAGEPVEYFDPAAYGVKFVANSVITSMDIFENRPQLVRRFIKGLMEGWKAALDVNNRENALKTLQRYEKETPPDILKKQIELTRRLVQPDPGVPIGAIDTAAWRQTETIMSHQRQINAPVNIERVLVQIPPD
ncbi:MAG: nitrate ABC transporter substrate-binding protein [Deltaproteobacteria bacterium RBG_13_49_15]|nr:MAG: nitrate ABC transporter substrate-binding protein [Deltaproteobacteria bacterium RBG_13_49_15]